MLASNCAMCEKLVPLDQVACEECMKHAADSVKPRNGYCSICKLYCEYDDDNTCHTGGGRIHWSCYDKERSKDDEQRPRWPGVSGPA